MINFTKNSPAIYRIFVELKKRRYYAKPSLKKRRKREDAEKQRVKDFRKSVRQAQQKGDW